MNLFVFGLGNSVLHWLDAHRAPLTQIVGTVRMPNKAARVMQSHPAVTPLLFDDAAISPALTHSDAIVVSIPPDDNDPSLARFGDAIAASPARTIIYLSTIGVYGDHQGRWIDEGTIPAPTSQRTQVRVVSENAWIALGVRTNKRVFIFRLSGIYGPGNDALTNLRAGTARRLIKPGQVFNRIHVDDIANAIDIALMGQHRGGIFNITDNEPAPPQDVVTYAADLLGMAPPPETSFDPSVLSPMARNFWGESKRVANCKMREELDVTLVCPTYREGLMRNLKNT